MKPTHETLDDLLRQRLAELPPAAAPAAGWERLADRLDHPEDDFLREALTGIAPVAPALGWAALESKLDPGLATDQAIADKLTSLEPVAPAGAWLAFERTLDKENAATVDAIVGDQLRKSDGGPATGWAALAARLELIKERRHQIVAWKITEVALLASLLLLFVRFGDVAPAAAPLAADPKTELNPVTDPLTTAAGTDLPTDEISSSLAADNGGTRQRPQNLFLGRAVVEQSGREALVTPAETRKQIVKPRKWASEILPTSGMLPNVGSNKVPADDIPPPAAPTIIIEPLIATIPMVRFDAELPHPDVISPVVARTAERTKFYLNAFISPVDANQVITNGQAVLDVDVLADSRFTQGRSGGALLEITQGATGIQFGAVYSRFNYTPTVLKYYLAEEFPFVERAKGYSRFKYDLVEFPFSINQRIAENERWRWSARMTASVSVIAAGSFSVLEDDEDFIDVVNRREKQRQTVDPAGQTSAARSSSPRDIAQLIDPPPGWLQGGGFLKNANLYLGGGFMIERLLDERTSIYVSPSFGRAVYLNDDEKGVGPYRDRLHTGQLRFGARHLLGRK
ncbi:hypothetical protein [Neolewinella antarctica]|uniref:Uncharacterized protein n=1 Tax=Neolewinella antarctica TaxID=442734 RepID=A0ABX0XA54_9BACT|nr:hypothetical protein [Neolewinella antarctica]NJC26092.1 hypothetical protein [Neolewinella antarctica]